MPLTQPGTPIVLDRSSPERRTINEHVGEWRRLVAHLVWDQKPERTFSQLSRGFERYDRIAFRDIFDSEAISLRMPSLARA